MRARSNVTVAAFAVVMLGVLVTSTANAKGHGNAYDVISTISNGDGTNVFVLQSDNQPGNAAASASYSINDSSVSSYVGTSTDGWELALGQQTLRTVYLDFSKLGAPVANGRYNATMWSRCYTNNGSYFSFLSIAPGTAQTNCSLRINFNYNGSLYSFVMSPTDLPSSAPATGLASVGCNSDATDNSGCNSWTITPYGGGANPGVVDLLEQQPNGLATVVGSYSGYTFRVDLER
ncbi:MAG TPA: hypothetical protein VJT08_11275 [Terriglobales bacterium]|nr:hypothetical protein [Terriglobales bacterium]